ncbi:MAG: DUF2213 domain-containing protein, partial [Acetobacteraceae bacterium]
LGLVPSRMYPLFRPPEELARAAPTMRGKPILMAHQAISAGNHPRSAVVGAVGTDVVFVNNADLCGSLTFWDASAIALIEDGTQADLSAAYRYRAVPERGWYQGARYDFRMADI